MRFKRREAALLLRFVGRTLLVLGAFLAAGYEILGLGAFAFLHMEAGSLIHPLFVGLSLLALGGIAEYISSVMTRRSPRNEKTAPIGASNESPIFPPLSDASSP